MHERPEHHRLEDAKRFLARQWRGAEEDVSPHDSVPLWPELAPEPVDAARLEAEREDVIAHAAPEREPDYELEEDAPATEPQRIHP